MKKFVITLSVICLTISLWAQRFDLGDKLNPQSSEFEYLGTSSRTGVSTYRYKNVPTQLFFGRQIGDIVVGVRRGMITLTIYNLIPRSNDHGVPSDILKLIQDNLPFPLGEHDGVYGMNIDNETISIARDNNPLTFNKDRIMIMNSVKQSILENTK